MRTDARAAAAAAAGDAREEERGEAVAGGGSSAKVSAAHDADDDGDENGHPSRTFRFLLLFCRSNCFSVRKSAHVRCVTQSKSLTSPLS